MVKAKNKQGAGTTKPPLFTEEQPVESGPAEKQAGSEHIEQSVLPDLLKKRVKNKKAVKTSVPVDTPEPQDSEHPITPVVVLPHQESPTAQLLPDPKLAEERAAQLKDKHKKQQEERLAALKRVRGNK